MLRIKPGSIIKGSNWPEPVEIKLIEEAGEYYHIVCETTLTHGHIDQLISRLEFESCSLIGTGQSCSEAPWKVFLALETIRYRFASLYDPLLAMHTSKIHPLPHQIEALYFKGMKYVDVELRPFNVLVGPNASGKSTLLDILTFLSDVLNESPTTAVEKRCSQFKELVWNQERDYLEIAVELRLPPTLNKKYKFARYEIAFLQNEKSGIIIGNEQLWLLRNQNDVTANSSENCQFSIFPHEPSAPEHIITQFKKNPAGWRKVVSKSSKGNDYFRSETTDWNITYRFGPQKASLARIPEDETRFRISLWAKSMLIEGIQFLQLNSVAMRWPCRPDAPVIFEADGSNLPKVIKHLQEEHSDLFDRWVEHVKTALPDVEKISFRERPEDRFLLLTIIRFCWQRTLRSCYAFPSQKIYCVFRKPIPARSM